MDTRIELLRRAVAAIAEAEGEVLAEIFANDVTRRAPGFEISSLARLAEELSVGTDAFDNVTVDVTESDIIADRGYAEWTATATHTGTLVADDLVVEATGAPLILRGRTVADFVDDRIRRVRQYWNDVDLLEGLGLLPAD